MICGVDLSVAGAPATAGLTLVASPAAAGFAAIGPEPPSVPGASSAAADCEYVTNAQAPRGTLFNYAISARCHAAPPQADGRSHASMAELRRAESVE